MSTSPLTTLLIAFLAIAINTWTSFRFKRLSRDIAIHLGRERQLDDPGDEGLSPFEENLRQQMKSGVGLPVLDGELARRAQAMGRQIRITFRVTAALAALVMIEAVVWWFSLL
ncbi:hypothetical protein ACNI65_00875 [Roseateles sp. So40a]|uniref:hypothetical protein n=1 Tax=Roseateles sp. So40a TaxID=3400226 RepID=UPI003A85E434